jgi:hypothetical protein
MGNTAAELSPDVQVCQSSCFIFPAKHNLIHAVYYSDKKYSKHALRGVSSYLPEPSIH